MILPVIMAGGSGSRLWPLSRAMFPKQFLRLHGERSMLQETLLRLELEKTRPPLVICNEDHRFIVAEQMRQQDMLANNIILEPVGRNTAPAIALAALTAVANGEDPILLILAADHVIKDITAFHDAVEEATLLAEQGRLVTFGIVPTGAETGYGYIQRGENAGTGYRVARFVEKPDLVTAQSYLESGEFLWNSGMFMFKASRLIDELQKFRPDILEACKAALGKVDIDLDFIRVNQEAFKQCPDDSIDYAVMEKTDDAVVVPMGAGWSDVGSWATLWEVSDKDSNNNVAEGDVILQDSHDSYVYAEEGLVATVGVDNLVIVKTKDAVLVAHKDRVQEVKKVVERLKAEERSEYKLHREVYRPWGKYDSIDHGPRYQVKRITVKPGEKLSIQMHHHRAEHWVVVCGTAKVTIDDKTSLLTENDSVYIPVGSVHSLENPGKIPLELIEVQSGTYLGEDDIVRFEDRYGRI